VNGSAKSRPDWRLVAFLSACQLCGPGSCLCLNSQEPPVERFEFGGVGANRGAPNTEGLQEAPQSQESPSEKKRAHRGEFVVAPLPISSPAQTGWTGIIARAVHLFATTTAKQTGSQV